MAESPITRVDPGLMAIRASNAGPMTLDGTCSYLVGTTRLVLIDPGPNDEDHLTQLLAAASGRSVMAVLLTHAHSDHSGLSSAAVRAFKAPIMASAETLARTGLDGHVLIDGQQVSPGADIDLVALVSPGHSADHLTYFSEKARWLFTGDLVLGEGSSAILHPDGSVSAYLASLDRLASLQPSQLFPGHGFPVDDAVGRLSEYTTHRLQREQQILTAIQSGARSVTAIRAAVYDPLPVGLEWAAEASIAAHLFALAANGHEVPPFSEYGVTIEQD